MWYVIAAIILVILIVLTTVKWKKTDRYLITSFNTDEMKLLVYESDDGAVFHKKNVRYFPRLGNKTVRDPSYIKVGGEYYIVYTVIDWGTGHEIGMCKTKDFYSYEELPHISVGEFNKVWAPTFYVENNKIYIIVNAAYEDERFASYIMEYDIKSNTVSEPVKLKGLPSNVIDTEIYKINEQYYLFYKNEDTKYVELAVCSELLGEYKVIGSDDWAGWGKDLEGPCLVQKSDGKYLLYLDNYDEHQIYITESDDLKKWSDKKPISIGNIAHLCIKTM